MDIVTIFTKSTTFVRSKRAIIESVNDQLKNISQIEHSRHGSLASFLVNIIAALLAYSFKDKKPSVNIRFNQLALLA